TEKTAKQIQQGRAGFRPAEPLDKALFVGAPHGAHLVDEAGALGCEVQRVRTLVALGLATLRETPPLEAVHQRHEIRALDAELFGDFGLLLAGGARNKRKYGELRGSQLHLLEGFDEVLEYKELGSAQLVADYFPHLGNPDRHTRSRVLSVFALTRHEPSIRFAAITATWVKQPEFGSCVAEARIAAA